MIQTKVDRTDSPNSLLYTYPEPNNGMSPSWLNSRGPLVNFMIGKRPLIIVTAFNFHSLLEIVKLPNEYRKELICVDRKKFELQVTHYKSKIIRYQMMMFTKYSMELINRLVKTYWFIEGKIFFLIPDNMETLKIQQNSICSAMMLAMFAHKPIGSIPQIGHEAICAPITDASIHDIRWYSPNQFFQEHEFNTKLEILELSAEMKKSTS
ncbi:hypothetical protein RDWZM_006392 [Blomia tropicalis]|uniref:Uncharacterized protein n=1 Tax=Blomia tropicalis TaxID=40697 RepID=A0A9Q0MBE3_BLOTA|nr:hypothetical protein BLOT_008703 [Blomia tropicalis]KAJ6220580.1 hypothetical protein RDWZM_006392 [Blomia tropicalis]